jgi:hypothetical protein
VPGFTLSNSTVSHGFEAYVISIKSQAIDRCGRFDVRPSKKATMETLSIDDGSPALALMSPVRKGVAVSDAPGRDNRQDERSVSLLHRPRDRRLLSLACNPVRLSEF